MIKFYFLLFCLCTLASAAAQNHQSKKSRLTDNSIVKDSTGFTYPPAIWKNLLMSGKYTIVPVDPKSETTEYLLKELSAEEKQAMMARMHKPKESDFFRTGAKFSSFNETDIKGNKFKLKDLKGKIIVLNFWFIQCKPCRMEIPDLNEMVEKYNDNKDVVFIAIALDGKDELEEFLKQSPFQYNIVDNGRSTTTAYGVKSFPTHVIVDREGKIAFHTTGLAPNTVFWVKKTIDELLAKPAQETAAVTTGGGVNPGN